MTYFVQNVHAVEELSRELVAAGFSPFLGSPCDALAPLYEALDLSVGVLSVPRDDNAIGIAAGVALAGGYPAVLLRNCGPGSGVEAIATVVTPNDVPLLLIVALAADADLAPGDLAMNRLSEQVLADFGIESVALDPETPPAAPIAIAREIVCDRLRPAALLVPAESLGARA
jgi:sulfopyruvate decarboxylase subunit alpha